jgi:4'-phosphopantetheinyl transferase
VSGVGINCRIGIDVEMYRPLDIKAFIPYLTTAEQEYVRRAAYPERELLHCWSMREAVLKADGRGLLARESSIRNIHSLKTQTGEPWQVEQLEFDHGSLYLACDCSHPAPHREQWNFTELLQPSSFFHT